MGTLFHSQKNNNNNINLWELCSTVKIGRGAFRGRGSSVQINIGDLLIAGKQNMSVISSAAIFYVLYLDFSWVLSKTFAVAVFCSHDMT